MRRDSIFYRLFQQSPLLLFELLATPPANAADYRFDSVAVKEPRFEIDGVFLPPETAEAGIVYFCEVQVQRDECLYERVFGESMLYFYRNRQRFSDWQAVVIYPSRSIEQRDVYPHRSLLNGPQVHRVYLDELGDIRQLPLGVALMVLTMIDEEQAPQEARHLLMRTQQEALEPGVSRGMIEMVTTIMVYKFTQMSRVEVEAMLGMSLQETRVYQEAKAEGEQIGEQREKSLVLRQLTRRFGDLPREMQSQVTALPLEQVEALGEALLDFSAIADLTSWLQAHRS
jgi:predicted transposase/invertase (TIGR01784 family)